MLSVALVIAACSRNKDLVPTGGSRADGPVDLSYELELYEKPVLDREKGLIVARQRCASWGYKEPRRPSAAKSGSVSNLWWRLHSVVRNSDLSVPRCQQADMMALARTFCLALAVLSLRFPSSRTAEQIPGGHVVAGPRYRFWAA